MELIMVILRKPGKLDYSIPKAYRPIALLNTTAKLLSVIVTDRASYLLESQTPAKHALWWTTRSFHYGLAAFTGNHGQTRMVARKGSVSIIPQHQRRLPKRSNRSAVTQHEDKAPAYSDSIIHGTVTARPEDQDQVQQLHFGLGTCYQRHRTRRPPIDVTLHHLQLT